MGWTRKTIWLIEEGHAREITNLKKGTCLTKMLKVDFLWVITSWSIFGACFEVFWSELLQCWALISASSAAVTCAKVLCTIANDLKSKVLWSLILIRQDLQAEIVYHENNQCNWGKAMSFQAFFGFKVEPANLKNKYKLRTIYIWLYYMSIRALERQDDWCL